MWSIPKNPLAKQFEKIGESLVKYEPEWRGLVSVAVTITSDNKPFYKKVTFGVHEDYLFCLGYLYGGSVDDFSKNLIEDTLLAAHKYAVSTRLYAYPYIVNNNKKIVTLRTNNLFEIDEAYVLCHGGDTINQSWKNLYHQIDGINKFGVCYRTDGDKKARRVFNDVKRSRFL
jgi:hypothetical protein